MLLELLHSKEPLDSKEEGSQANQKSIETSPQQAHHLAAMLAE